MSTLEITKTDAPTTAPQVTAEAPQGTETFTTTSTPDFSQAPKAGTPEYQAWLEDWAAKQAGGAPTTTQDTSTADTKILGKFASQDDLVKAYQELEKKLGAKTELPAADTTTTTQDQQIANAGVDRSKYSKEFNEKGALSTESYAELAAKGFDKTQVDEYIDGLKAKAELQSMRAQVEAEKQTAEVLASAGGDAEFNKMRSWAAANFSDAELTRFNAAVGASKESALMAVELLKTRYVAANGRAPAVQVSGGNASTASNDFKSMNEVVSAMNDPRYRTDAAYRADVQRRIPAGF
jgi:hypothetical protein